MLERTTYVMFQLRINVGKKSETTPCLIYGMRYPSTLSQAENHKKLGLLSVINMGSKKIISAFNESFHRPACHITSEKGLAVFFVASLT